MSPDSEPTRSRESVYQSLGNHRIVHIIPLGNKIVRKNAQKTLDICALVRSYAITCFVVYAKEGT